MTKDEIIRKYKQYLFPSVSTYFAEPLVTDHASMQYLWDADGKKYLDFFGGIVTISAGHTNPRITSKIKAQIDKIQHASTLFPNEAVVALAEKLAGLAPGNITQSYFTNSGTEAPFNSRVCTPAILKLWPCAMDTAAVRNWHSH
jgi:4-aminobutyrate aminotransferase-like enzyme